MRIKIKCDPLTTRPDKPRPGLNVFLVYKLLCRASVIFGQKKFFILCQLYALITPYQGLNISRDKSKPAKKHFRHNIVPPQAAERGSVARGETTFCLSLFE
jgi:hypothetical protein